MSQGDAFYIKLWDKSADEMVSPLLFPSGLLDELTDLSLFHCHSSRRVRSGLLVNGLWLEGEGTNIILKQSQPVL